MALTVTVTPGKQFSNSEALQIASLNQVGQPTFAITGTVGTSDVQDAAITPAKSAPGAYWYGVASGSADPATTYAVNLANDAALTDGTEVWFKSDNACAAGVTLNVDSLGAKPLLKLKGELLAANDIRASQIVGVRYSASAYAAAPSGSWHMFSQIAWRDYEYQTASGTNAYSITPLTDGIVTITADTQLTGRLFLVRFTNGCSTSCTLTVNTPPDDFGPYPIVKWGGEALTRDDIVAGSIHALMFDGTNFQLLTTPSRRQLYTGVDAGGTDAYAITTPSPAPSDYFTGMLVAFKANTGNTGACTLALGALAAKAIKINAASDPPTGAIAAGQWVSCIYDGVNFQLQNPTFHYGYLCKAWARVNGTVLAAGQNISGTINNPSAGTYDLTFTTAMTDANYAVVSTPYALGTGSSTSFVVALSDGSPPTTAGFRLTFQTNGTTNANPTGFSVLVFGNG